MALDTIIASISNRFSGARTILKDLALLSPKRITQCSNKSQDLPNDSFYYLSQWIDNINVQQLKEEYKVFSKSYPVLIKDINLPTIIHSEILNDPTDLILTSSSESEDEINNDNIETQITALNIMELISNYDLRTAFPNLFRVYQGLCTIPASSASAERSFSKVHI